MDRYSLGMKDLTFLGSGSYDPLFSKKSTPGVQRSRSNTYKPSQQGWDVSAMTERGSFQQSGDGSYAERGL